MRTIAVADDAEERNDHRGDDSLLHADEDHHGGGHHSKIIFAGTLAADIGEAAEIDKSHRDDEHDGGQYAAGKILQRAGKKKKNECNHYGGRDLRQLAAAAGTLNHSSLRGTAVDDKGAADSGGKIGGGQTEQVGIFVEALMVADGIDACGGGALSHDHHQAGASDGKKRLNIWPADSGQAQMRKASGDRSDGFDAAFGEVKRRAGGGGAHNGDQRPGDARS